MLRVAEKAKLIAPSVRVPDWCPPNAMNAKGLGSFQLLQGPDQLNATYATVAGLLRASAESASEAASSSARLAEDPAAPKANHPFPSKMNVKWASTTSLIKMNH